MNKEDFCKAVREKLMDRYAGDGWEARILQKGYTSEDTKELKLIKDTNEKYYKNLDEALGGDFIILSRKNADQDEMARFRVDYFIDAFNADGWNSIYSIIDKNIGTADIVKGNIDKISEYEKCKDRLIVRLLNFEKNKRDLEGKVYKRIGDFVMALYMMAHSDANRLFSFKVGEFELRKWGVSFDDAFRQALDNSCRLYPPRVYCNPFCSKSSILEEGMYLEPKAPSLEIGVLGAETFTAFKCPNGAVSFFYPGVAEKIAEAVGNEDYYVAFTSIEDFHIHRCSESDSDEILDRILYVNKVFPEEQMLTEMVYRYNVKTKELEPAG